MLQPIANILQGSASPVFKGSNPTARNLLCSGGCGQVLIERFTADCFAGIGIQCFSCGAITSTPPFPLGEVVPYKTIALNEGAKFNICGTVDFVEEVTFAAETEIKAAIETTTPKKSDFSLDISRDAISRLVECYAVVTGADVDLQRKVVARGGKDVRTQFPFIWAAQHLIESGKTYSLQTIEACEVLKLFGVSHSAWSHHPRYLDVARQMAKPGSFFHTALTFMAAHYLHMSGNKIGLSLEDKHGEPNPDLYLRASLPHKLFIEMKSPNALQASGPGRSPVPKMQSILKETVKRASGQINKHKPGVLVIGSTYIEHPIVDDMDRARNNTVRSCGRFNSGLAGLVTIAPQASWDAKPRSTAYTFDKTINPHFDGTNPLERKG